MNKLDRQIAIALLLQNRKSITAQKIAEYFEISVRTVYRDIQILAEAGVPVVSLPGEGYAIMEGYKLPPLMFDPGELVALHVGQELAAKYGDSKLRESSRTVRIKLEAAMPPLVRLKLDSIADDVLVQTAPPSEAVFEQNRMSIVLQAIQEKRLLRITGDSGTAEVGPVLLYFHDQSWLLIAAAADGKTLGEHRLSELTKVELLDRKFEPPADFTFSRYWRSRGGQVGKSGK
jgi:predicted DNA-binding transcriptional regulator YafY